MAGNLGAGLGELCENHYVGIKSLAYEPGPLSEVTEGSVEQFLQWYMDQLDDGEQTRHDPAPELASVIT